MRHFIYFCHTKSSKSHEYLTKKAHLILGDKFAMIEVKCHFIQVKFYLTEKYIIYKILDMPDY